jgi:hypothetical protein
MIDIHDDAAIIEQQNIPRADIVDQFGVVEADAATITEFAFCIEDEGVAILQQYLATGKLANTDFRALQVGHDADGAAAAVNQGTECFNTPPVIIGRTMGKIQSDYIDARLDKASQHFGAG